MKNKNQKRIFNPNQPSSFRGPYSIFEDACKSLNQYLNSFCLFWVSAHTSNKANNPFKVQGLGENLVVAFRMSLCLVRIQKQIDYLHVLLVYMHIYEVARQEVWSNPEEEDDQHKLDHVPIDQLSRPNSCFNNKRNKVDDI